MSVLTLLCPAACVARVWSPSVFSTIASRSVELCSDQRCTSLALCLFLVMAAVVEGAPIIAKQVKHADLPAVAPEVPPALESAPIKIIPKEDPVTSATLISKLVDPELAFLWSESGVQLGHQHTLAVQGYVTVRKFAAFDETRVKARTAFMEELSLAPRDRPGDRFALSALVDSWSTAHTQIERETVLKADSRALQQPLPVDCNVRVAMRRAVEARWEKLSDDETPGAAFIGAKQEQIEHNEPRATPLDEILSVEDDDACDLRPAVDITGAIRAVRMKVRVEQPAGPEQYRRRMRIESNVWLMLATKYFSRPWLQSLIPGTWGKFVDYVLGNKVHLLNLNADTSTTPLSPPWNIVLAYELRMRKRVFERIREEGVTLVDAVQDVVKDAELRELHFITPFIHWTHSPAARSASSALPPGPSGPRDISRPTKRQRTSRGRPTPQAPSAAVARPSAKATAAPQQSPGNGRKKVQALPDGRTICFKFGRGQCQGGCGRVHKCQWEGCHCDIPTGEKGHKPL